jgi:N-methylhydantoinase A
VAICFVNSYVNPTHEIQCRDILLANFPQLTVCASCDVLPEMKEYERTSTTVVNAYLLPKMQSYLRRLGDELRSIGIDAPIQVMASNGGTIGVQAASQRPVFAVASGPAGGVAGAAAMGAITDRTDLVTYDMGGTSAKAAVIDQGAPVITTEYEFREGISSPSRFIKGGGYMLKVPAIDIGEVGAGGGSVAYLDEGGLLHVGPRSVGSEPGPACYGRGNEQPTITDANVVLGLLNPSAIADGSLQIHREKAEEAVRRHIAEPLGISVLEAAHGIRDLANATMARALRSVTVERGRDPRDMAMMAFGGSGPMHAADVARILGIRQVVVPVLSGVFSSLGMLVANAEHNFVRTILQPLNDVPARLVRDRAAELGVYGQEALRDEGYADGAHDFRFSVDLRYFGQSSELTVPLEEDGDLGNERFRENLYKLFQAEYQAAYGYNDDEPVEIVSIRLSAQGRGDQLDLRSVAVHEAAQKRDAEVDSTMRIVSFNAQDRTQSVPVCSRRDLDETRNAGPLIVESYDTTIVLPPGAFARSDALGNVLIDL